MKDTIYRQEAIDALKDWYDGMLVSSFRSVERVIKNLPSAQPDLSGYSDKLWKAAYERGKREGRKTGKWIPINGAQWKCSVCGEYISGDADCTPYINKFCWNCGARMDEGREKG